MPSSALREWKRAQRDCLDQHRNASSKIAQLAKLGARVWPTSSGWVRSSVRDELRSVVVLGCALVSGEVVCDAEGYAALRRPRDHQNPSAYLRA